MRRIVFTFMLACFIAPMVLACSFEKSEKSRADDLLDPRFRAEAYTYIQQNKGNAKLAKYALPNLIHNYEAGEDALTAVYTIGELGDPAAVPWLLEQLDKIFDKDGNDLDRQTEQICIALGKIGEKVAIDPLIKVIKTPASGRRGKAGALQALGMFADPKAVGPISDLLKSSQIPLVVKHFGVIAMGKMRLPQSVDTLAFTLFLDDKTGLNLFRDSLVALLKIGGQPVREGMIKTYSLKNELVCTQPDPKKEEYQGYCAKIRLKTAWVQIKSLEVLGHMRDANNSAFMIEQFKEGVAMGSQMFFEVYAKLIQNMGRVADPAMQDELFKQFTRKPTIPDDLVDKELIAQALIRTGVTEDKLDAIMKIIEAGETSMVMPDTKKPQVFPQWPLAAANLLSMLDPDGKYLDRFKAVVAAKKIKTQVVGQKLNTDEQLKIFQRRLETAAACKRDAACWVAKVEPRKDGDSTHWAQVERALFTLGHMKAAQTPAKVMEAITYENEFVLDAMAFAAQKTVNSKEDVIKLAELRDGSKLDMSLQKPLEELNYILLTKKRDLNILDTKQIEESKDR